MVTVGEAAFTGRLRRPRILVPCLSRWVRPASANQRLNNYDVGVVISCAKTCKGFVKVSRAEGSEKNKPGTGTPLHTQEPVTVASFRTWRGWREYVAWDRCLT